MGTNYYRIPLMEEMVSRQERLAQQIAELDISPRAISQGFAFENPGSWDRYSPWDSFVEGTLVHLGKRSVGWKFYWNFHNDKYYKDKASLEEFVKSGRVVDEYGSEIDQGEFLQMAYEWWNEDGWDSETFYEAHPDQRLSWIDYSKHMDRYVDGLRISSSTDFC